MGVLNFDNIKLFFIFLWAFPESTSKLLSFLGIQRLLVSPFDIFLLNNCIHLFFQSFVLNFCQFNLVLQILLRLANLMFVIKVVSRYLLIYLLLHLKPCPQLSDFWLVVSLFQVKLLSADWSIFLIPVYCIIKKCFLLIDNLVQPLYFWAHSI